MHQKALFVGLVFDEFDQPLEAGLIGPEPAYVINDAGFRRHIPAEQIDNVILGEMKKLIQGNEGFLSEQTAKMIGADDLFSKAMIENQLKHIDKQFEMLYEVGIPEDMRAYLGMTGFKVIVDYHGNVMDIRQAGGSGGSGEGDGGE
ncbi:MAG: hypothetical protein NT121_08615 [Chloroflexi bacterium]|nr:hypothetical protein [Chloroflexota bacterium]